MPTPANRLSIEYRPYRRTFAHPLETAWRQWSVREGFLIRIDMGNGRTGIGEVAPLEDFGTESVHEAGSYLASLPANPEHQDFESIVEKAPPACAFGVWAAMDEAGPAKVPVRTATLMNLETMDASTLQAARESGYTSFKVKLGLREPAQEWSRLRTATGLLNEGEKLRLDPNRSWDLEAYGFWGQRLADLGLSVEFIEEPFQPGLVDEETLVEIAQKSPVPLALDESLSEDGIAKWLDLNWPGYWIVKPSLCGMPTWMDTLQRFQEKVVISSAFETAVGLNHLLRIAQFFPNNVHGLGTGSFFNDALGLPSSGGQIRPQDSIQLNAIWTSLLND
jgi:O-succinylbenzoate synthase